MNEGRFRRLIIRVSALNGVGFIILIVFMLGLGFLKEHDITAFPEPIICLALLNSGFAVTFPVKKKPVFTRKLLAHILIPGMATASALLIFPGILIKIYMVIFQLLFYFTGYRSGSVSEYSILTNKRIYIGIGLFVVSLTLSFYYGPLRYIFPYMAVLASLFSVLSMIVFNQRTLDYNIYVKRGVDASGVQKNLRSYNLKIVLLMVLVIAVLFNIKKIVIKAYQLAGFIISNLIYYFLLLIAWLFPESDTGNGQPMDQQDMLPFPEEESGRSIVAIILTILVTALLIFIVVKYTPSLVRAVVAGIKSLFNKITRFVKSFFSSNESGLNLEFEEFVDHVEIVKTKPSLRIKTSGKRVSLKHLKAVNDPIMMIRQIYRIIIYTYSDILGISKSDTAGDILGKADKLGDLKTQFGEITHVYEKARYGGIPPSNEFLRKSESYIKNCLKRS